MKLSAREDIEAPIETVFERVSDFDGFERAAMRRGAEVTRTHTLPAPGPGLAWKSAFEYRGRERRMTLELKTYDPPNGLSALARGAGVEADITVELVAMSMNRTRMNLSLEIRPKTIPARLVVQSMKLARQSVMRRFRTRVADFAANIEQRAKA